MRQGRNFETGDDLLATIMELMGIIEQATLERVCLEWMERLRKCISTNGEYVGGDESKVQRLECFSR
jgi:hypothetical protein